MTFDGLPFTILSATLILTSLGLLAMAMIRLGPGADRQGHFDWWDERE